MPDNRAALIGGDRLARNVIWNLIGTGAPLIGAVVAVPILISGLGVARFGVLMLAWMLVGYFSLFDFGLGRALTKLVAEKLGQRRQGEIPTLIWTAVTMMVVLGIAGAIIIAVLSPWIVLRVLQIPTELQHESLLAFRVLAVAIPFVIVSTGLRGILEAYQRFALASAVRIPLGLLMFLGPVLVLPFSSSLVAVIFVLVIVRLIAFCAFSAACFSIAPDLRRSIHLSKELIRPLINFGGWMTVTNIVSPLMVYMDRFLIGAVASITAVTYYAAPYEIVTKLWIIPGALMGVAFPAFATTIQYDISRARKIFYGVVKYIFVSMFPIVVIIVTVADAALTVWLGSEFAQHSAVVMQLLAVGVLINSLAFVPYGLLQGAGRPDITAKLHIAELPVYLLVLWLLLDWYGIIGAAIAWLIRVAVDSVLLFLIANRMFLESSIFSWRLSLFAVMVTSTIVIGGIVEGFAARIFFLLFVVTSFLAISWNLMLNADDRALLRNNLRKNRL